MIRLKLLLLLLTFSISGAFAQWAQQGNTLTVNARARHDLAFDPQTKLPYMVFADANNGNKASVARLVNGVWQYVTAGISAGAVDDPEIEITANGTIYIAYIDFSTSHGGATVMYKTTSTSTWSTYGSVGFTPGVFHIDFHAEDLNDGNTTGDEHLFITYLDHQRNIAVMVNDDNCACWNALGSAVWPKISSHNASVVFSMEVHSNKVSVGYNIQDLGTGAFITHVKQADLTSTTPSWNFVGNFAEYGYSPDLAVNPLNGQLAVAYTRYTGGTSSRDLVIKSYNGSQWSYMGSSSGIATSGDNFDFAYNPLNGLAHILYYDNTQSNKASVKQFNGSSWSSLGAAGFTSTASLSQRLAFSPENSLPHVSSVSTSLSDIRLYSFYDGCSRTLSSDQEQIYTLASGHSAYEFEVIDPVAQTSYLITPSVGVDYITASQIPNYTEGRTYKIRSRGYYTVSGVNYYHPWTAYCYITTAVSDDDTGNDQNPGFGGGFTGDKISLYPNPTSSTITLGLTSQVESADEVKLNILSSTGQLVRTIDPSFAETDITTKLDLSDLAPGMYMISGFVSQQAVNKTFIVE